MGLHPKILHVNELVAMQIGMTFNATAYVLNQLLKNTGLQRSQIKLEKENLLSTIVRSR